MVVKSPVFFKLALGVLAGVEFCVVILRSDGVWGQILVCWLGDNFLSKGNKDCFSGQDWVRLW